MFFQSHPGFAFGNENVTKEFYDKIMCKSVGDALHMVVERGQRWKCPTYKEGITPHPHSILRHCTLPRRQKRTVIMRASMQGTLCMMMQCSHGCRSLCVMMHRSHGCRAECVHVLLICLMPCC